jgi:hypothetical protein
MARLELGLGDFVAFVEASGILEWERHCGSAS